MLPQTIKLTITEEDFYDAFWKSRERFREDKNYSECCVLGHKLNQAGYDKAEVVVKNGKYIAFVEGNFYEIDDPGQFIATVFDVVVRLEKSPEIEYPVTVILKRGKL